MTTKIYTLAMTDPQLYNNNNSNCNQNSDSNTSINSDKQHKDANNQQNTTTDNRMKVTNNNNNNNSRNNNHNSRDDDGSIHRTDDDNDAEPKYLHKKFKKLAKSEVATFNCYSEQSSVTKESLSVFGPFNEGSSASDTVEQRKPSYICPYCKLSCAKPSVLQKHIRAHTNERPFPCVPCGFAFKTKSNLYKHCRSRAHAIKIEGADNSKLPASPQPSEHESEQSLSDSASTGTGTPPPVSSGLSTIEQGRIYKPKFHTALHHVESIQACKSKPQHLHEHIERIINDNQAIVEALDPRLYKLLQRQQSGSSIPEPKLNTEHEINSCLPTTSTVFSTTEPESETLSESEQDFCSTAQPLVSPGPLLGNTRLVDEPKKSRLEINLHSLEELPRQSRSNALQMFGGQVRILGSTGESRTLKIEPGPNQTISPDATCSPGSETTSVVVRSNLQSGGTMLHKFGSLLPIQQTIQEPAEQDIAPRIEPPSFAPSLSCLKPMSILHAGRFIPFVPGMPGPQSDSPTASLPPPPTLTLDLVTNQQNPVDKLPVSKSSELKHLPAVSVGVKFLRPSSLPLKPGTFTPKQHHGITPTAHTLALISPETPRPKKSYGQLYLNGHAYTYLGLKCSTRLFYCTLNRPQPMYVLQQHGLSMYSNWKVCKEAPPKLELQHYDSRHRPIGYTLANSMCQNILTHSSYRPTTPSSSDNGLESDSQDKTKRIRIFYGGFKSNEDYTYIRGRGRGRYVCEECGIRCKKPSMLKKHIRTHTDVRPYMCKHCSFSFKTKGNLTKHMKSKAHYKKCLELNVIPVPTSVCEENIDNEALNQLALTGVSAEDSSSSEDESEPEAESDESGNEEHEAAQGLLRLATRSSDRYGRLPGLLSSHRPTTYPYENSKSSSEPNETRLSVIRSCNQKDEISMTAVPIDLTKRHKPSSTHHPRFGTDDILAGPVSDPKLLQSLVQTMERLPIQNSSWPVEPTDGHMLQAYITERHMMDSKLKQQYRVSNSYGDQDSTPINSDIESDNTEPMQQCHYNQQILNVQNDQNISGRLELKPPREMMKISPNQTINKAIEQHQQQQQLPLPCKVIGGSGFESTSLKPNLELIRTKNSSISSYVSLSEDNRNVCSICNKIFSKPSHLRLHMNIHYFERLFKCKSCGTSFRTKGHLTKHERSTLHHNKVSKTSTFGAATASNPRPFKCTDCQSAFRIHGHLAKHLRSKMHIMKLECLRKLPFGTYAEMERSGMNLNDIDTTDCDTSLTSLQVMAQKLCEKDPSKLGQWEEGMVPNFATSGGEISSDESESNTARSCLSENNANTSRYDSIRICKESENVSLIDTKIHDTNPGSIFR